ncbi:hypothetical protein L1I30_05350 [Gillisia sp. M10.2A]|uniref:Outer membrane protein beta-barrel domain-containing protein n=1 Tax=Gillisia lutea TaxID=2909668 RepID=A0ABS9EDX5_9FLAO|nr:hypothetical protein [Gillisia lutea]MCF4101082.1 hypothetical protein [Gillisia lutea]
MKKTKNIDDLFRDKFRDAETQPPSEVWENISQNLPQKERERRLLPFWFKLAGTAAALLLLFTLYKNKQNNVKGSDFYVISSENKPIPNAPHFTSAQFSKIMLETENFLISAIKQTEIDQLKKDFQEAYSKNIPSTEIKTKRTSGYSIQKNNPITTISEQVISDSISPAKNSNENRLNSNNIESPALAATIEKEHVKKKNEKDLLAEITNNQLNEDEDEEQSPSLSKRFSIAPTAAAVYFDNIGKGNSIDKSFADNNGSGDISMAYGVNLAYQISEKIKIRSGLSKVNLSYTTQNISYASALNSEVIEGSMLSFTGPSENGVSINGSLNQNLSFLEVPAELEYNVLDSKFGINLIGGVSTLFLNENSVSLNSANYTTNLGEASNLNKISFTGNLGVGLNYKISPLFQFNFEPIFKYQLNTFSNTSNFKPYYFGIYSGVSFKF